MSHETAPLTPVVQTSGNDEVAGALVAQPDSTTNFADHGETREWLLANVQPLLQYVRDDGVAQRDEWSKIRRMAELVRDETAAYTGNSQAYLPVFQKALETRVSHLSRGLFPTDTYIDATPVNPELEANAPVVKAWMLHQMERNMKLRAALKPWLRSLNSYGMAVGKVWWEKNVMPIKQSRMTRLPGVPDVLYSYGDTPDWMCEGARFQTRSVFSWYIWPTTVNSIDEASLVFEDIQVSKQFIQMMERKGIWKNTQNIIFGATQPDANRIMQEQLGEIRKSTTTATDVKLGELATWAFVSECWLRMPVPRALYTPNETPGEPVPVKVVFCGGEILEVRRNPFWHQRPPYLLQRMNENTESIYTVGMGRGMLSVQSLINDFMNQTNDNGTYGLNPVVKINPNNIVGPIEPLAPGRMWHLTDPAGAVFDRPPIEQMQYGLMLVNQLITYANDLNGTPSVLQGSGAKGGAKTATGAQILQGNVKGELQDLVEDIELRTLQPLMEMVHSLGQQYESAERFLAIAGGEKVQFSRDQLEGEFMWKWVASSQAVNQQMRAQQSIQFAQLAGSLMPLLQAQGKMFDPVPLLRRIYEDGLGQRGFDRVIVQAPMGLMGPLGAPGAGGPAQKPGDRPRSAVEQAAGGSGDMVPGEGEAFGEVRQQADAMAAMLGGGGAEE